MPTKAEWLVARGIGPDGFTPSVTDRDPGDETRYGFVRQKLDEIYGQQCADTDGLAESRAQQNMAQVHWNGLLGPGGFTPQQAQEAPLAKYREAMGYPQQPLVQDLLIATLEEERDTLKRLLEIARAEIERLTPKPEPMRDPFSNALRHSPASR